MGKIVKAICWIHGKVKGVSSNPSSGYLACPICSSRGSMQWAEIIEKEGWEMDFKYVDSDVLHRLKSLPPVYYAIKLAKKVKVSKSDWKTVTKKEGKLRRMRKWKRKVFFV